MNFEGPFRTELLYDSRNHICMRLGFNSVEKGFPDGKWPLKKLYGVCCNTENC